jgi:hypothetical protein
MPSSSSPAGRYYMPETPPLEPSGLECWTADLADKFIEERVLKSKKILSALRQANMKDWLLYLERTSQDLDLAVRQKFANDKAYTNNKFELQSGQIYRRAERKKQRRFSTRYAACYNDTFEMICKSYKKLAHARKSSYNFYVYFTNKFIRVRLMHNEICKV